MSPPTGEEEDEEEGKVEEEKQSEAPPGEIEPVAFQEEAGSILEANDQVSIVLSTSLIMSDCLFYLEFLMIFLFSSIQGCHFGTWSRCEFKSWCVLLSVFIHLSINILY
jgi:hypothetical protein